MIGGRTHDNSRKSLWKGVAGIRATLHEGTTSCQPAGNQFRAVMAGEGQVLLATFRTSCLFVVQEATTNWLQDLKAYGSLDGNRRGVCLRDCQAHLLH